MWILEIQVSGNPYFIIVKMISKVTFLNWKMGKLPNV